MLGHERPGVELAFEDHGVELGLIPHLRVSWDAYWAMVDELVLLIVRARFTPNQIVAITFGGVMPGRALAQALKLPLAYLGAESYVPVADGDRRRMQPQEQVVFARDLIVTRPGFGTNVLLVDDLADHGRTFAQSVAWLQSGSTYSAGIREVRTACLWRKTHSTFQPQYVVDNVKPVELPETQERKMPWIDQPLERLYATGSIADIEDRIRGRELDQDR